MTLPLLALMEDAPTDAVCRHTRSTTSPVHQPSGTTCCNHDETCNDCGLRIGTESWNLALGLGPHAKAYPEAA